MRENEKNIRDQRKVDALGWLKLYIIGKKSTPSSRTVYIRRNNKIYAVLHTDTSGGTKSVSLPAMKGNGTEYICELDDGEITKITIYPFVVNVHYIDKTTEEV